MIDDLSVSSVFEMWKYVDDSCRRPSYWLVREKSVPAKRRQDQKTITFSYNSSKFPRATIDDLPIESVEKTKLLGVIINSSLTWNDHVEDLVKKAFRKLYFLVQLKRAQIPPKDLVAYYCACIRSTLDYACPLFHHVLPKYLQLDPGFLTVKHLTLSRPRGSPLTSKIVWR